MKFLFVPALAAALLTQAPPAHTVLAKRYHELYTIIHAKSGDGFDKWITYNTTPSFVYRANGAEITAPQMATGMRQEVAQMASVPKVSISMGNIAEHPKTASCSVTTHLIFNLKNGKKLVSDATTVDSWVLTSKGWRLDAMVLTRSRMWLDGKQVAGN